MVAVTAQMVMQIAMLSPAVSPYQEAYEKAGNEGKPFLVFVGADWCPSCQSMKNKKIPALIKAGGLKEVVFTSVNSDKKPELAAKLLKGKTIPQLVLYTPITKTRWRRSQLTGVHEPAEITTFISHEIAGKKSEPTPKPKPQGGG